jgi:methanethiol S-methyltransferase
MRKFSTYLVLGLAGLSGGGSLLAFTAFLYAGSLCLTDLGLGQQSALLLDAGLSLLFFIQHSGMVRRPFHKWLNRFVPDEYNGAVYSIASGIVLSGLIIFWQEGTLVFTAPDGIFRWAFRALFWLSILGFLWAGLSLKAFDPFGLRPVLARLGNINPKTMPFSARGPFRLVRHPLYLFSILMIWSCPDLTTDRLLFNFMWTVWIVIGAFLEERDLVAEFGDIYREYRRKVPMFIPGQIHTKRNSTRHGN